LALAFILVVGLLLALSAVFLDQGVGQDLLINLAATVLGVVLTAIVLEPLIDHGRRPDELIHFGFPHADYIAGVRRASHRVRIMGAWPYVMEERWRRDFLAACSDSLNRGTSIQILVLDPLSSAAEQRQSDLDNRIDVSMFISDTLVALQEFENGLAAEVLHRFEVRIYSSLPPARLYSWDRRAISSFFPRGSSEGIDVKHYETNVMSGLARYVDQQFDLVWNDSQTEKLDLYFSLRVIVPVTGTEHCVQHITLDGGVIVASRDLVDEISRGLPDGNEAVLFLADDSRAKQRILRFEIIAEDDELVGLVAESFQKKYGSNSSLKRGFHAVIRLLEDDRSA
jgi:uncharacterized membrane protein YqaE (UPF0057 family)